MSENLWLSDVLKGYRKNIALIWVTTELFVLAKVMMITKNDSNQNIKETMVGDNVMIEICSSLLSN